MILFNRWIYVIPGFTQTRGTRTRLIDLWARLHSTKSNHTTTVQLQPWKSDWKSEAEFISRLSVERPRIFIVAYSWGAGYGFIQLARQLAKRGIEIARAWLLDPVYRHPYWLGQWRAFVPGIPIVIPENVRRVTWWRQEQSWPRGHELRAISPKTRIDEPHYVRVDHVHMDDHRPTLHQIALELQEELL